MARSAVALLTDDARCTGGSAGAPPATTVRSQRFCDDEDRARCTRRYYEEVLARELEGSDSASVLSDGC